MDIDLYYIIFLPEYSENLIVPHYSLYLFYSTRFSRLNKVKIMQTYAVYEETIVEKAIIASDCSIVLTSSLL